MGVPKFFRWVAERYPAVITPFKDSPPQVDNLYLDMNGIIHNCTHPNDFEASRKAPTEEEIVQGIYAYIEKLFNAIQPRKYFLMAVDGVAPRAKMNQQRQRRYRSGYDMMVAREEALARGEELPEEGDVFDSNCITPGTTFMERLTQHFHYFVEMKLQTDTAWQNCKVIFSGHDHPGEGEHKIVDFIRGRKSSPNYCPNETHCMYGLDADLVMLALATHEPRFVLLREVVSFGTGAKNRKERERQIEDEARGLVANKNYGKEDEFVLFHVNIFRDYLHMEIIENLMGAYASSRGALSTAANDMRQRLDFERIIDDFVFMCFFVGNDFLPSIPTISINDGHIQTMMELYRDRFLANGQYLTEGGGKGICWGNVEKFLAVLGESELDVLRARQDEEAKYQDRQARNNGDHEARHAVVPITSMAEYKERYYHDKHEFADGFTPSSADMAALRLHYVEALTWVLGYYYQGPPSWQWFFPHHYTPLASDLTGLAAIAKRVQLDKGQPFLPHQQLLAVLPPMSYRSLPEAYWPLLRSKNSPLTAYFPERLLIDTEGARAPWEGIVLIPFMKEDILLAAYNSVQGRVTAEDAARNKNDGPIIFSFNPKTTKVRDVTSPYFPTIHNCLVDRLRTKFPAYSNFEAKLCDGYFEGELEGWFSLTSKKKVITPVYEAGAVAVFGMPTRRESMLLEFSERAPVQGAEEAYHLVGKEVLVGYPHYKRARVVAVADSRVMIRLNFDAKGNPQGTTRIPRNRDEARAFAVDCDQHRQQLRAMVGLNIPDLNVLVYVNRFNGMKVSRKLHALRDFASAETPYPLQLVQPLTEDFAFKEDERFVERALESNDYLSERFLYVGKNPGSQDLFGCVGRVIDGDGKMFTAEITTYKTPQGIPKELLHYASANSWRTLRDVARALDISPLTLTHISGSLTTSPEFGSIELGLCLKFTGKNLARVGYCKMVQKQRNPWYVGADDVFARLADGDNDSGVAEHMRGRGIFHKGSGGSANRSGAGEWYYSDVACTLVANYVKAFKPLVEMLESSDVNVDRIMPPAFMTGPWAAKQVGDVTKMIEKFIADAGVMKLPMLAASEDSFTVEHLRLLEDFVERSGPRETSTVIVRKLARSTMLSALMKTSTGYSMNLAVSREQRFRIGARVACCRTSGNVAFGAQGTVVRLLGAAAEVVFDAPFPGGSTLANRIRTNRGAIVKLASLLNISLEERLAGTPSSEAAGTPAVGTGSRGTTPSGTTTTTGTSQVFGGGDAAVSMLAKMIPSATVRSQQQQHQQNVSLPSPPSAVAADLDDRAAGGAAYPQQQEGAIPHAHRLTHIAHRPHQPRAAAQPAEEHIADAFEAKLAQSISAMGAEHAAKRQQ